LKVTTIKIEDFDEAILIVQVCGLLDGGSSVNIIYRSLRKKLGLKKPKSTFFVIRMVNQKKCS
jgi:hypothetical protein